MGPQTDELTNAALIGTVDLDWRFAGIAPIHGPGTSDLVLRNVNTGAFEVYDINNNQLTRAWRRSMHPARPTWSCATPTPARSRSTTSPIIKSSAPRAWGRWDWIGNSAGSPPALRRRRPHPCGAQVKSAKLVQAMAGFGGGGAGESLNTAPLAPDTAQQPLLTPPQHG